MPRVDPDCRIAPSETTLTLPSSYIPKPTVTGYCPPLTEIRFLFWRRRLQLLMDSDIFFIVRKSLSLIFLLFVFFLRFSVCRILPICKPSTTVYGNFAIFVTKTQARNRINPSRCTIISEISHRLCAKISLVNLIAAGGDSLASCVPEILHFLGG